MVEKDIGGGRGEREREYFSKNKYIKEGLFYCHQMN